MTTSDATAAAALTLRYSDSAGCRRWLERLPLTNVPEAQRALAGQLAGLTRADLIAPLERLRILETLRAPLTFLQQEAARLYAGQPLPLAEPESDTWARTIALWQGLARNYDACLGACRDGDLVIAPYAGLITLRCLAVTAAIMDDHYRVYRQPSAEPWLALNRYYAAAEQGGYPRLRIQDVFGQHDPDTSCQEVYVRALLLAAAHPYALSVTEQAQVRGWLAGWAALVTLTPQAPPAGRVPPLTVDLAAAAGARVAGPRDAPTVRHLDLDALAKTLRHAREALRQGQTPAQLGLGAAMRPLAAEQLLLALYTQWFRAGTARGEDRLDTEEPSTVCFGLSAAHYQAAGDPAGGAAPPRPARGPDLSGLQGSASPQAAQAADCSVETWFIRNYSTSGFMCMTRHPDSRTRIAHNQLLAVRRASGRLFHLGMVQWVKIDGSGELQCGVRLFPGTPQAVAVRPSNFNPAGGSGHVPALVLPEVPAPATPATIVLPAGWFQSGRFIEIFSDRKQVAKLLNLLEKGSDFERGTMTIV